MSEEKLDAFSFVKAIQKSKKELIRDAEDPKEAEKAYVPYMANKALSMYIDSIMYANEMNLYHNLDKDMQFSYHLNSVRSMNRKFVWFKKSKDEDIKLVSEHYGVNAVRAQEMLDLIGSGGVADIKKNNATGGAVKR